MLGLSMYRVTTNKIDLIEGLIVTQCPSCNTSVSEKIGHLPSAMHFCTFKYYHPINRGDVYQCRNCGLWYKNPCLTEETLDELYLIQPESTWKASKEVRLDFEIIAQEIKSIHTNANLNILDVGCFDGDFLSYLMNNYDFKFNCFGIEPSIQANKIAEDRGVKIIGKTYKDLSLIDQKFDVIVSIDVLEHVYNTNAFVRILSEKLKPNGILIIVTGSTDNEKFLKYKSQYYYCSMPEHVTFMNRDHAIWLANKNSLSLLKYFLFVRQKNINSPLKARLKNLLFRFLSRFPDWLFSLSITNRLANLRGSGILPSVQTNDHALVILKKIQIHNDFRFNAEE